MGIKRMSNYKKGLASISKLLISTNCYCETVKDLPTIRLVCAPCRERSKKQQLIKELLK